VNVSICDGQSYFAGGAFQTASGVYVDSFLNYIGCDSVLTTNLTVLPNSSFTVDASICDGQSYYAGGNFQTNSGVFVDTLINSVGCDSVLTTNLTVLPNSSFAVNVSICTGQSYFAGGTLQTTSGTYLDTLINHFGCDSVLTTNLSVLSNSSFAQNVSICNGQSYFAGGALQTVSGVYLDTFVNVIGCDSVLTTNLTVLPNTSFTAPVSICDGQSYFAGGTLQTTSGIYLDTFINYLGCDSVLTTNLTVLPNSSFTLTVSICDGQSYYAGGGLQTTSGIYFDTLANSVGCDSVITTDLAVLPNSSFTQDISICTGDSIFIGGAWQTQAGNYIDHYLNYLGCDSALITHLILLPILSTHIGAVICAGESYYAGGANQTLSGVYVDSLTAITGCDSIVTTDLNVLVAISTDVYPTICDGEKYFAGGSWQTTAGIYFDTLSSFIGCDSGVITHLTVNPNPIVNLGNDTTLCEGSSTTLNAGSGFQSYLWQDQSSQSSIVANEVGSYWVIVTNSFGCSASDTMQLTNVYPLPDHFLVEDTVICGNIPLSIEVPGFENYLWNDGDTASYKIFTKEGTYSLQVIDVHGCSGENTTVISNACDEDILVPNAFTPNNDGLNDVFLPIIVKNLSDYDMKIFNRWGQLIFESNDISDGWDGFDSGTRAEIGTYLWNIEYVLEGGTIKRASGYVSLLR
jgi:gliding motility-associated-like protein